MKDESKTTRFRMIIEDLMPKLGAQEAKIASWMIENEDKVAFTPLKDIASLCSVSQPTVVRFCKKLGCSGTKDFRVFFDSIRSSSSLSVPCSFDDTEKDIFKKVFASSIESIEKSFESASWEDIDALSSKLLEASNVFVFGIGRSLPVASFLSSELRRLGLRSTSYTDPYSIERIVTSFKKEDALVFVSRRGETESLTNTARKARAEGAYTIALTSAEESTLSSITEMTVHVKENQYLEDDRNSYSILGQISLISALYITSAKKLRERDPGFRDDYFGITNYKN